MQSFVDDVLRAAPQLLTLPSALDVEGFASSVAGTWWQQPSGAGWGPALVSRAQQAATPEAAALLRGLAAVGEPALAEAAQHGLDQLAGLGHATPPWSDQVGRAGVRQCFTFDEEFGDATQVIMSFAYADEPPHALVVLVDHSLGGIAKDIWAAGEAADLMEQVRATAAEDPQLVLAEADPATLRPMLLDAVSTTDQTTDPPVSDSFRQLHALLLSRVRALPEGGVRAEPPEWSDEGRAALVQEFVSAPEAAELPPAAAEALAVELVGYGADQDRGQPLRVSPTKTEVFLLGWLPMTGLLDAPHIPHVPAVLAAWVRFAAGRTGLSEGALAETLQAVETFGEQFPEAYRDPERWGPARATVEALVADIDPTRDDVDDVFARRMFALPVLPAPDFDARDDDQVRRIVASEHPEYSALLSDPSADPVHEGVDIRAHLQLHLLLARQLWFGDPPEVWTTAQRLLDTGLERDEVVHALAYALSTQVSGNDPASALPDAGAYREALDALPDSWREAAQGPADGG